MSELNQIASEINRARQGQTNLSNADLENLARRLAALNKNQSVDPKVLANNIARSTASAISGSLPSPGDFLSAFVSNNPLLSIGGNIINSTFGKIQGILDSSRGSNSEEITKLSEMIEEMKRSGDSENPLIAEATDTLTEILTELKKLTKHQEESLRQAGVEDLQRLDTDKLKSEEVLNNSDALIKKMIENQERSFMLDVLATTNGFARSAAGLLGGLLGGAAGGGILGALGGGLKKVGKFLGPIGLVVGGLYEMFEGVSKAEEFFGKQNINWFDKMRYAGVHLISSLLSPVDWMITTLTGENYNLRERFDRQIIDLQNKFLELISPLTTIVSDGFGWMGDRIKEAFNGISPETLVVDIPGIMAENIREMFIRGWEAFESLDISGKISNKLNELGDDISFLNDMKNSILESIRQFFINTFNRMLEAVAVEVEGVGFFGMGEKAASAIRGLKAGQPSIDAFSGADNKNMGNGALRFKSFSEAERSEAAKAARMANMPQQQTGTDYSKVHLGGYQQVVSPVTQVQSNTTVVGSKMETMPSNQLVPNY